VDHRETDTDVRAKAAAAHRAGLIPIICVGETEAQRDRGEALDVVCRQLSGSLPGSATGHNIEIAYEPVWAIGTGRTPTTDDVAAVHNAIRQHLVDVEGGNDLRILYGGSVKPDNAADLMSIENVDGALVGGASLKAEDFWGIVESCR
jgi:triosephosphate isomerase